MRAIRKVLLPLGVLLLGLGCGDKKSESAPAPTQAAAGQESAEACGSGAANTPEHCACLGGYVRGDIGDGHVSCPQGETELERVKQGIEGAICCKALVQ